MEQFEKLGLSKEIVSVLKECEFEIPSEIQEKAIPIALSGRDVVGGSATGSGKTLVFAAPIIDKLIPNNHVQALVLVPTRELADQVSKAIKKFAKNKKLHVNAVYGGVGIEPQIRKMSTTDVVVGTPGRILDHLDRRTLRLDEVKFLVLDELDRMFDMGFYRDVEKIIRQCPEKRQTMLFSATISSDVGHLIKKYTTNPVEISVESYVDATKLKQVYYDTPDNMKFSLLVHLLRKEEADLVMVFCNTRRNVDFISKNLNRVGINAQAIHGGLSQNQRSSVLDDFHGKGVKVMICTDVAARGLDIKGVSHVYNYDLPTSSKDYIHRIGRTARAGEKGKAISILASRDYENFGFIKRDEAIKIEKMELPEVERVEVRTEQRNFQRRGSGGVFRGRSGGERSFRGSGRSMSKDRDRGGRPPRAGDRPPRRDGDRPRSNRFSRDGQTGFSRDSSSRSDRPRRDGERPRGNRFSRDGPSRPSSRFSRR